MLLILYYQSCLHGFRAAISEFGSLRKTLEKLAAETDAEHKIHADVATKLFEQSSKLSEFRERYGHKVVTFHQKVKPLLYSLSYAKACNGWRGPSPRLSAWATQSLTTLGLFA